MKWLFGVIFLIFLVFAGLVMAGYLAPASLSVSRSTIIDAEPDDVFPYINDLSRYEQWSPLHAQIPDAQIFYGGADSGVGMTSVWKSAGGDYAFGTQEIIASEPPEFVQLAVNLAGREATSFYGLQRDEETGGVIILLDTEFGLGGFPYVQRIVADRGKPDAEAALDAALTRLKTIVENDLAERDRAEMTVEPENATPDE